MSNYVKVKDARGHSVRGLWERGGKIYAQIRVPGRASQIKALLVDEQNNPVTTVPQAKAAYARLLDRRSKNDLPSLTRTPTLQEWAETYLDFISRSGKKDPKTIASEHGHLREICKRIGSIRLAQLRREHIDEFVLWRRGIDPTRPIEEQAPKVTNRTINIALTALRNCLKLAKQRNLLFRLPTDGIERLPHKYPKRPLWTDAQVDAICGEAKKLKHGQLLADFIRFLEWSGARRSAALNLRWSDVHWDRKQVHMHAETKFDSHIVVDFNPQLEAHLTDMYARRGEGEWVFPSPFSGGGSQREAARNMQSLLEAAREAAGLPDFQYHDARHKFISHCVMRGVDFMTIAKWVGHKDGGVLIGKVYGHLNDEHARSQAAKLGGEAGQNGDVAEQLRQMKEMLAKLTQTKAA